MWGKDQFQARERRLKQQRDMIKAKKEAEKAEAKRKYDEMLSKNKDKMRGTRGKFGESKDEKKARLNRAFAALGNIKGDLSANSKVTSA